MTKSFQRPFDIVSRIGTLRLSANELAASSVSPEWTFSCTSSPRALKAMTGDVPRFACHWAKMPHLSGGDQSSGNSVDQAYQ